MIRVNLLPVEIRKKKKKPKPIPAFLVVGALLLTVSVIASLYANYYFKSRITGLQNKKTENEGKLTQLSNIIKEVGEFEKLNKAINERKDLIEQLRKTQNLPVKILFEISEKLTEGIWLITMTIRGNNIDISGVGFSNSAIVTFVQNLKTSELFKDVYLHGTNQSKSGEIETFTFKITFMVQAT